MQILYAGQSLAEPLGGGEISARSLLTRLAEFHHVHVVGLSRSKRKYSIGKRIECTDEKISNVFGLRLPYHLQAMRSESEMRHLLAERLRSSPPDLLILQQPAAIRIQDLPKELPVVIFIRSPACYGVWNATPNTWGRVVTSPLQKIRFRSNSSLLNRANLILTNSSFLKDELLRKTGLISEPISPFIENCRFECSDSKETDFDFLMVGLDRWKGAGLVLRLASELPNRKFLILEGGRSDSKLRRFAQRLSNITLLPWTENMAQLYKRSRVCLMPSLWEEPFGRVPVEAAMCGVPTIASRRGGLVESVGDGGILIHDFTNLTRWSEAIANLDNSDRYSVMSQKSLLYAKRFSIDTTISKFSNLVAEKLSIELFPLQTSHNSGMLK